ncbi:MAG: BREX-6 system adenine-specific DNA-methyltransferase PglX [Deltaproteobacteria bacterium]|nr:MAG: BREX-6 system adenine-specific DNA-methyltransferase PglX [Deltaproteobacteria bacterium]
MPMTPEAKRALSKTIRELRERLLTDLHAATERAYRLSIAKAEAAGLTEAPLERRRRLEAWLDEQTRALPPKDRAAARERFRRQVEQDAAATLLNRLVFLRLLEGFGLREERVLTGGWDSAGYKAFRELAPALVDVRADATEGYATLLHIVFEDLAVDLPGLFGPVGLTDLVPVPPATLRAVVEALDAPELLGCWDDDMTLGWVYQYWNDPEREALDAKLNDGGKVEPHEIASKTQMFTERYMVEWLLQNSLGQIWRAYWTPFAFRPGPDGTSAIDRLEARRAAWRARREAGEVALDALMPVHADEEAWKYWVEQPLPEDLRASLPEHPMDLKILDPACGSGHFLVVAFDLLWELYGEKALDGREQWGGERICMWILEKNLHGVDLDPRAVQIAAAALLLKAWTKCPEYRPGPLNLVATRFGLAELPADDPARIELRAALRAEAGLPEAFTDTLISHLAGVDHLGTLLRVDKAIDEALAAFERPQQHDLFSVGSSSALPVRSLVQDKLETFLAHHTTGADLGLRLRGEELTAGVRFVRLVKEGRYHLVVANPPYQGTAKMADSAYVQKHYPKGKADLFAAFLERGLQLARRGGMSAMVTMQNWMFIKQYEKLRKWIIEKNDIRAIGDIGWGGFEHMKHSPVTMAIAARELPNESAVALCPAGPTNRIENAAHLRSLAAGFLCGAGRYEFETRRFRVIEGEPLVYWWPPEFLDRYDRTPKLGQVYESRVGMATQDNSRYLRYPWEVATVTETDGWVPFVKGGAGREWIEPVQFVLHWPNNGARIKIHHLARYGSLGKYITSESHYFRRGICFSPIGARFSARAYRRPSVFSNVGASAFPPESEIPHVVLLLNSSRGRQILSDLNPSVHFELGDAKRLPVFLVESADAIYARLDEAFTEHEAHREPSVEFVAPGPSRWDYAQDWAQRAVDRPEGAPLPEWAPVCEHKDRAANEMSYALGRALGRFGDVAKALPHGILYLSSADDADGLSHPAARPLHDAWARYGAEVAPGSDLRTWLRTRFFNDVHLGMYEKRPIHWPLSSANKSFVAWVNIHRWTADTLRALLAEHLLPESTRLEGRLADLVAARHGGDKAAAREAERRYAELKKLHEELVAFVADIRQLAEKGPPPTDARCPKREVDARYVPDLDDGVMVNSAALWPVLAPQWRDPKGWWKELAEAKGRKDYDWAHLAARYFPDRVDKKCKDDPSLAVAHGCFWRYHPDRALSWELRLQDEIGPDFILEEPDRAEAYARLLADRPDLVREVTDKETKRRHRKHGDDAEPPQLGFDLE